jgi:uncharacterized protein
MVNTGSPTIEVDLEPLDAFLLSERAPDNCMGLSDLDGFLTGIVVGPEFILPSEWLPIIWGGDEPEFATIEEALSILGTIMSRYIEINARLDADPDGFDPVFWEGTEGEIIIEDWAAGFLDAIRLRTTAWEPLALHRQARALIIPMLLLGTEDEDRPPLGARPLSPAEMKELLANDPEIISDCVIRIRAFWKAHATKSAPKMTRQGGKFDRRRRHR